MILILVMFVHRSEVKSVNAARCLPDPTGVRLPTSPTDSESPPINLNKCFNIFNMLQIFTQLMEAKKSQTRVQCKCCDMKHF